MNGITDGDVYDLAMGDLKITYSEGYATLNGITYNSGSTINQEGDYTLVIRDLQNQEIIISFKVIDSTPAVNFGRYNVSPTNIITNVIPSTSVFDFLQSLVIKKGVSVVCSRSNNELLGTGTTLDVTENQSKITYHIIVFGDVDGSGEITIGDLAKMKKHLLNSELLNGNYFVAGDVLGQGKISLSSLLAIKKSLLGIAEINQNV